MTLEAPAPLCATHRVEGFSSGVQPLDDWLIRRARNNQVSGASHIDVVVAAAGAASCQKFARLLTSRFVTGRQIIVLQAFIKKTQNTPRSDLRVARKRLKEVRHG